MYSIGEIISTYRKKKGLLQQDLADELAKEGITISYKAISNWERNLAEPSVTIFYKVCRILGITNMYEAYFGVNPADPFSSLTDEGREKAMDYINLLHASGMYEKQTAKIIPFRSIDIFENAVSAGTGNFLVDGPKETVRIDESILPEDTTFGVRISGDSMEPEFHDGQIADKTQVLFIGHIILHNDNKKISIELKEGIFMAVTNNIREIREQRGIYQDDLAAAIGYSTKTVGRIERGDSTPSAEFMLRISKYFNMLVEDVFHVED